MRGHGVPRLAARAALQQRGERLEAAPAAGDLEHRADQDAVHVAQERVGRDPEAQQVALGLPARRRHRALEVHVAGARRRERGEVVPADQCRRARVQRLAVDAMAPPQRVPALERRPRPPGQHAVAVGPRHRVVPGVEAVGRRGAGEHRHVGRQDRVERARVDGLAVVRGDLPPGVHAAVGAPGDGQRDLAPRDRRERPLELLLHGALAGLARPAREGRAVVLEVQAGRGHRGRGG